MAFSMHGVTASTSFGSPLRRHSSNLLMAALWWCVLSAAGAMSWLRARRVDALNAGLESCDVPAG